MQRYASMYRLYTKMSLSIQKRALVKTRGAYLSIGSAYFKGIVVSPHPFTLLIAKTKVLFPIVLLSLQYAYLFVPEPAGEILGALCANMVRATADKRPHSYRIR